MASIEEVLATVTQKVSSAEPFGKTIKFLLDGNIVFLDGNANPPTVSTADAPADVTINASLDDIVKIMNKQLSPQMAFMLGKVKLQGDMMAAMVLQKIF